MGFVRRHLPERYRTAPIYALSYIVFLWSFALGAFVYCTHESWWEFWAPVAAIAAAALLLFAVTITSSIRSLAKNRVPE